MVFFFKPVLSAIKNLSEQINIVSFNIMSQLSILRAEIEANKQVTASAVALLNGLHAKLQDAIDSGDHEEIQSLADDLKANTDSLGAAVAANTDEPKTGIGTDTTTEADPAMEEVS